ncbi:hypothetical protein EYF80_014694 [Liparis tanakae]|uniref:Uncharacterized protein n=1 Tax=Liparis tanakae TaxID=230148 RepID=A0A4Z2IBN1_9TELE|nr:hypothetical protein EYF80_014694 [Liparis tanakae]
MRKYTTPSTDTVTESFVRICKMSKGRRHFTSSVGHIAMEEKMEAKEPADAFWISLKSKKDKYNTINNE